MSDKIIYPYRKCDGFVRPCRKGCPNCKHCTDVWWDYSHGIYGCECELEEEGPCCDRYENDGTEPVTVEDFDKMKEEENERIVMNLPPLPWLEE